jgi:predicted component of type VI protein secretion system
MTFRQIQAMPTRKLARLAHCAEETVRYGIPEAVDLYLLSRAEVELARRKREGRGRCEAQ